MAVCIPDDFLQCLHVPVKQFYGTGRKVALDELRHDLIGSAVELQVIVEGSSAVLLHAQQIDEAHGGGAFQAGDAHFFARPGRCAAGQQQHFMHKRRIFHPAFV